MKHGCATEEVPPAIFALPSPAPPRYCADVRRVLSFISFVFLCAFLQTARAWEPGTLLLWINGDKGYEGIDEIGRTFTEQTGIPVVVEHPEGATDKFFQSAKSGKGPDVMI